MFKKLFNKLMPNKEQNNDVTVEPISQDKTSSAEVSVDVGIAVEVESTSQSETFTEGVTTETNEVEPTSQDEMSGVEVPAGPQVPGVNMTQDVLSDTTEEDSQVSDATSEPIRDKDSSQVSEVADETIQDEDSAQSEAVDPMIPVKNN